MDWNISIIAIWKKLTRSPSSRGRGLKCKYGIVNHNAVTRRPLHEGVDWNRLIRQNVNVFQVALFTRAWIEIIPKCPLLSAVKSRPLHEGVDWNRRLDPFWVCVYKSPSSRGRGLKLRYMTSLIPKCPSPSSRGRGLKYHFSVIKCELVRSPSSRGRGLKFFAKINRLTQSSSPSSRGRGLKSTVLDELLLNNNVALFTRAWIEMAQLVRNGT